MEVIFYIGLIALVIVIAAIQLARSAGTEQISLEQSFRETGVLIGSEIKLSYRSDFAIAGRVDQLWRVPGSGYVLVDTKNRQRAVAYPSDQLQLSIYAWLLRRTPRYKDRPIAQTAYVRVPDPIGPARFLPVSLLSDEETEKAIRLAFARRKKRPERNPPSCYRCGHCGHFKSCQPV